MLLLPGCDTHCLVHSFVKDAASLANVILHTKIYNFRLLLFLTVARQFFILSMLSASSVLKHNE